MKADTIEQVRRGRVWLTADECDLDDFAALVERTTDPADYPFAEEVVSNVLVYDGAAVREAATSPDTRRALLAEWVEAMTGGPGVVVFRGAFDDTGAVDAASDHFWAMIDEQRASHTGGGDHFAKPGANDRIWNALEKLCLRDPAVFAAYYGNEIVALVSEAWLGPGLPDHLADQRGQSGRSRAVAAPRLPPRLPGTGGDRALSGPRASALAGPDAPGRGRPLRHAGRDRPDPLSALLANIPSGLSRHRESRSSATISTGTTYSSPSPRATRRFSIRPSSMPPATIGRGTSGAWRTCSRCPRHTAGRWRASTALG